MKKIVLFVVCIPMFAVGMLQKVARVSSALRFSKSRKVLPILQKRFHRRYETKYFKVQKQLFQAELQHYKSELKKKEQCESCVHYFQNKVLLTEKKLETLKKIEQEDK